MAVATIWAITTVAIGANSVINGIAIITAGTATVKAMAAAGVVAITAMAMAMARSISRLHGLKAMADVVANDPDAAHNPHLRRATQ
jgi:hypothetical protein